MQSSRTWCIISKYTVSNPSYPETTWTHYISISIKTSPISELITNQQWFWTLLKYLQHLLYSHISSNIWYLNIYIYIYIYTHIYIYIYIYMWYIHHISIIYPSYIHHNIIHQFPLSQRVKHLHMEVPPIGEPAHSHPSDVGWSPQWPRSRESRTGRKRCLARCRRGQWRGLFHWKERGCVQPTEFQMLFCDVYVIYHMYMI